MNEMIRPPKRNIPYSKMKQRLAVLLELAAFPLVLFCRRANPAGGIRKIVLVEPFMLGDASFLSVMLDPLKARFPAAEIHLFIQPKCAVLYQEDPRVAQIHAYHMPWIDQRGQAGNRWLQFFKAVVNLRREKIDLAIDVRGEVRSQILMVSAGIPRRAGFINYLCSDMEIKGRLLSDNAGMLPLQHRIHTCLDLCALVGCPVDHSEWLPHAAQKCIPSPERVLVHTGAGGFLRVWPVDRWAALLQKIQQRTGCSVILAGAPQDAARNKQISEESGFSPEVKTTSFPGLLTEIDAADLLICLDSAPLHLAVLRHKPVLALFGPGPTWLYEPVSVGSRVVHHQERFNCAPCPQQVCSQETEAACMLAIRVDDVFNVFCEMISKGTGRGEEM